MTIEIFTQAQKKYDPNNPPTKNRFFVFILQYYRERVQNISKLAGATVEEYNQTVEYFDNRGGSHFARPNRRNLDEIRRTPQAAEERKKHLDYIRQLPEMAPLPKITTEPTLVRDYDDFDHYDYKSETTPTRASRASGSTGLKRRSDMGEKDAKTMTTYPPGAHTIIIMNNPRITNFNETTSPMTPTTQRDKELPTTVHSTPRAI
eukprot:5227139-Amphidinium_carterae.1